MTFRRVLSAPLASTTVPVMLICCPKVFAVASVLPLLPSPVKTTWPLYWCSSVFFSFVSQYLLCFVQLSFYLSRSHTPVRHTFYVIIVRLCSIKRDSIVLVYVCLWLKIKTSIRVHITVYIIKLEQQTLCATAVSVRILNERKLIKQKKIINKNKQISRVTCKLYIIMCAFGARRVSARSVVVLAFAATLAFNTIIFNLFAYITQLLRRISLFFFLFLLYPRPSLLYAATFTLKMIVLSVLTRFACVRSLVPRGLRLEGDPTTCCYDITYV